MVKLADIPKKTPQFWYALSEKVCNAIRDRVQKEHKNANGETFSNYSEWYANLKSQRKAVYRGGSQASTSTVPDMTLTGKTMADLKTFEANNNGATLGWIGLQAGIVESLHNHKNYRIVNLNGDPFAKKEMDMIMKALEDDADKKIKAYCQTPTIIKIGA